MKTVERLLSLAAAVLLLICLAAPAMASEKENFIQDYSANLSPLDIPDLNAKAKEVSEKYDCGVYVVMVPNYSMYGYSVEQAAENAYKELGLGMDAEDSGILLFLSMITRDYDLCAYGYGNYAFTDYGKTVVAKAFRSDFERDDWAGGIEAYIASCDELLQRAENNNPVDIQDRHLGEELGFGWSVGLIVVLPCLVALIVCSIQAAKLKSVKAASQALEYAVPGSLRIYDHADRFSHVTTTRVKIESESRGGGGGGGTSVNSGGFSHSSGKF